MTFHFCPLRPAVILAAETGGPALALQRSLISCFPLPSQSNKIRRKKKKKTTWAGARPVSLGFILPFRQTRRGVCCWEITLPGSPQALGWGCRSQPPHPQAGVIFCEQARRQESPHRRDGRWGAAGRASAGQGSLRPVGFHPGL